MRFFVSLSFKGQSYCGWQVQQNANSVQAELEKALSLAIGEPINVVGAGRTDTGVNAINYIAHFNTSNNISKDPELLLYKINAILPLDISINNIFFVADDAHARFDATSRTYKYFINNIKDPFATFSYYFRYPINMDIMNKASKFFLGNKDFSSLEKVNGGNKTSICTVYEAYWKKTDENHFVFTVTANRFLRNMVRAMVGTLLEVGKGKKDPEWILEILEAKNRSLAGQSVPGNALFLTEIKYPYPLTNQLIKKLK